MGTNFYLRRKLSKNDEQKCISAIQHHDYELAKHILSFTDEIHIGKRSAGWKFLWDVHNFEYFKPTIESLMEFLKSGEIYDEYGKQFSLDDFLNKEIASFLVEGYDLEEAYTEGKGLWWYRPKEIAEFKEKHNVDVNEYGEFYIDEFRCTIDEDFS